MSMYAGQKKVLKDIEKRLKQEQSAKKSQQKKNDFKTILYYAKLLKLNKEK